MLLFNDKNKIQDINGIKLTNKQIEDLKWYKVKYKDRTLKQILNDIHDEELYHVDDKGLPSDEHWYILE
ncbi:MAG: hypothetical protein II625_02225, partial [Bacilli bacterium]|nr:hypothetical protein [Bacilli bacterium]